LVVVQIVRTVAVDFDGVIHAYGKGWHDGTIYDELMSGAVPGLRLLMRDYAVFIHTARNPHQVADWIQTRTAIPCSVQVNPNMKFWDVQGELLITNRKLPAIAYVDDRAIRFRSWPQALGELDELSKKALFHVAMIGLQVQHCGTDNGNVITEVAKTRISVHDGSCRTTHGSGSRNDHGRQ